ncbi:AAA family ATPase [Salipaludibacillus sp. HK11]|uniref:AAA family ATPase n=1 Tax=Salipaludibacillus sp. HK11 TaxID=3394320 RepID=UPI0039FCF4C2
MKPLKIKITAFGPYKNEEVIDFSELNDHKLFVISGKTGAGKTAIFDAICFALYGDASGEDRNDIRTLRSDFADDDLHTSVAFEFELKSRVYRVFRQLSHVKQGNKSGTGEKYEFYETTDGKEIPLTDRFIVSQVNDKIQAIIGLTKEQFSQIVMLPQGEFRKLLTSETENKEEILRRIFKTGFYKSVVDHLNEKRREAQKRYEGQVQTRNIHMENIKAALPYREESELFDLLEKEHFNTHQVIVALDKEISFYEQSMKEKGEIFQKKEESWKEYSERFLRAQGINKRIELLDEKNRERAMFDEQKEQVGAKERQLGLAEKASQLEVYENLAIDIRAEFDEKRNRVTRAKTSYGDAVQAQQAAQTRHDDEEKKADVREITTKELDRIEAFLPTVTELEGRKKKIQSLAIEGETLNKKVATLDKEVIEAKDEKTRLSERLKPLEESVRSLPDQTEKQAELRTEAVVLQDYLKHLAAMKKAQEEASKHKAVYEKIEQEFESLEARWLGGQASILAAEHLHHGEACPVCGSEDHPAKAVLTDDIPTKEELDAKRHEKKQVESAFSAAQAKANASQEQVEAKKREVIDYRYDPDQAEEEFEVISEKGIALGEVIKQLKQDQRTVDELKKAYSKVEERLEVKTKEQSDFGKQLTEMRSDYKTEKSLYDQSIANIPEELRSLEQLKIRIQETEAKKRKLDDLWKHVQKVFQQANEQLLTAKSNLEHAEKQVKEVEIKRKKVQKDYLEALEKAGFETEETYKQAKLPAESRDALKVEIDEYHAAVKTVTVQIADLQEELKDKERTNLESLQETLNKLKQEVEETRAAYQLAKSSLETAGDGKEKIVAADKQLADYETEFQLVKDLYDVVRGENTKKVSFERYLQIEFLEQIIHAANERLKSLSNGQYYLVRSDRLEKRGRQSGLGLDVLDNYTGQMRDVKTLSGGEKFNASLCLALGMADVIQAYEGGISIETMFIDEGFGSLDEESLQKAIDTLVDLQQSGRMIGVISHVQEMKQVIPATLEVRKSKEGHSETKFVLR